MTLSAGFLLALYFLAPGFALYLALFGPRRSDRCRVEFESPNAVLPIAFIGLGAIFGHGLWSALCLANQVWVGANLPHFALSGVRPIYELVACIGSATGRSAARTCEIVTASDMLLLCLSCLAIILTTFGVARAVTQIPNVRQYLDQLQYGWVADLMRGAREPGRFIAAFILSNVESNGTFLGYQGQVDSLNLDARKEVSSISVRFVGRYILTVSARGVVRTTLRRKLMPHLYIERANVRNITLYLGDAGDDVPLDDPLLKRAEGMLELVAD